MARSRDGETGAVGSGFEEPASGATVFEDSTGFVNVIDKRGIIVCLCVGEWLFSVYPFGPGWATNPFIPGSGGLFMGGAY